METIVKNFFSCNECNELVLCDEGSLAYFSKMCQRCASNLVSQLGEIIVGELRELERGNFDGR